MRPLPFFAFRFLTFVGGVVLLHLVLLGIAVMVGLLGLSTTVVSAGATVLGMLALILGITAFVFLLGTLFAPPMFLALGPILLAIVAGATFLIAASLLLLGSLGLVLFILGLAGVVAIFASLTWFVVGVHRLPPRVVGLGAQVNLPAVPFRLIDLPDTLLRLIRRYLQAQQAKDALTQRFTLRQGTDEERTASAFEFLYGSAADRSYPVDEPEQFSMPWTAFDRIDQRAAPLLPTWAATLTDADIATREFWPNLANYHVAFNIPLLERLSGDRLDNVRTALGDAWTTAMEALADADDLYAIDMRIFGRVRPPLTPTISEPRFTPDSLTLLRRGVDADGRVSFEPFFVRVSNGAQTRDYSPAVPSTWLYALQAAKVSITVYGIWIGHVYSFHIVTAAMQMTMFQQLPPLHPVRQLFGHQSDFLIGFDQYLFLDWSGAPPTSLGGADDFLRLADHAAASTPFFDQDPQSLLDRMGLDEDDFTSLPADDPDRRPWDRFPVARYLLALHRITERYITDAMATIYPNDAGVAADGALQAWLVRSAAPIGGNISGLPPLPLTTRAALSRVLTSLVYRVTAHGASRLSPAANPAMTFIANYPPCLEASHLPDPQQTLSTAELLAFLPKTGTMGDMTSFLFIFAYSPPYVPFIPVAGVNADLPFVGAAAGCNGPLVTYRRDLEDFIQDFADESNVLTQPADMGFAPTPAQLHQWELNIET